MRVYVNNNVNASQWLCLGWTGFFQLGYLRIMIPVKHELSLKNMHIQLVTHCNIKQADTVSGA